MATKNTVNDIMFKLRECENKCVCAAYEVFDAYILNDTSRVLSRERMCRSYCNQVCSLEGDTESLAENEPIFDQHFDRRLSIIDKSVGEMDREGYNDESHLCVTAIKRCKQWVYTARRALERAEKNIEKL